MWHPIKNVDVVASLFLILCRCSIPRRTSRPVIAPKLFRAAPSGVLDTLQNSAMLYVSAWINSVSGPVPVCVSCPGICDCYRVTRTVSMVRSQLNGQVVLSSESEPSDRLSRSTGSHNSSL